MSSSFSLRPCTEAASETFAARRSRTSPTRIMKNSSKLFEKMLRNFTRSSRGTSGFSASPRTRRLNSSQLSSRSRCGSRGSGAAFSGVGAGGASLTIAVAASSSWGTDIVERESYRLRSLSDINQLRIPPQPCRVAPPSHAIVDIWDELGAELQDVEKRNQKQVATPQ